MLSLELGEFEDVVRQFDFGAPNVRVEPTSALELSSRGDES